jgi:hypothetical protein
MGLNKPFDRDFYLIDGAVKTSGGSLTLAKGQLAAVDQSKSTANGLTVVTNFAGKAKNKKDFALRAGIEGKTPGRSYSDKDYSTVPFALNEVVELSVSAPKITEHIVDEVVIGYDGTPGSEFTFHKGDAYFRLALELKGGAIDFRGGNGGREFVGITVEIPDFDPYDDCTTPVPCTVQESKDIILEAVRRLREKQLTGGNPISDFIDITPVLECDTDLTAALIQYDYYTLSLCDTGDDSAKAIIQAQYNVPVIRINRSGSTSTYQLLLATTAGAPADFSPSIGSLIKGCAVCPSGYTAAVGGYVYAFTIEDDGSDQSALITAMTNYVTSTVVKSGNSEGVGFYTAVFSAKISDAQIATLTGTAGARATATVDLVGKVSDICTPDAQPDDVAWTIGDSLNAVSEGYEIWLADDSCGNDILTELQAAYDGITINLAKTRAVTLTGTSGTANITVAGTAYLATFATSLTVTANNFVTAHAAALLLNKGIVVTAASGVLTFANVYGAFPTITAAVNATGDLAGTLGTLTAVTAGCQHKYITSVISNLVGDECDAIYKNTYITSAPTAYFNTDWTKISNDLTVEASGNCKAGIRFKSKVFVLDADEALRDTVGFVETSTQIQVAAGFPDEIREGIGHIPTGGFQGKYLSRQQHRTHLAGNLRIKEAESKAYFRNTTNDKGYLGRLLRGETSNMQDSLVQYIQYKLKISSFNHTQSFAGRINNDINYNIFVEVGKHTAVEDLLNNLAANAGVAGVQAFGI